MAKSRLKGQSIKALSQLQKEFCYFEFDNQIRVGRISEINQVRNGTRDEDINMYPLSPSKLLMRRHLETLPLAFNADDIIKEFELNPNTITYRNITFSPKASPKDTLNYWVGPQPKPTKGSCSLIISFLKRVICNSDEDLFHYLESYLAHMIQKPEEKPGVMIILLGGQGTGKGTFFRLIEKIWQRSTLLVSDIEHVIGGFNASLERNYAVCMDEALFRGQKKAMERLKSFVTEPTITIEQKYQPRRTCKSIHRFFAASNQKHFGNIDADDRRFLFIRISEDYKDDHKYFDQLHRAMEDKVQLEGLVFRLSNIDLSTFNIREKPVTNELILQKLQSLNGFPRYWYDVLSMRMLNVKSDVFLDEDWEEGHFVSSSKLYQCYQNYFNRSVQYETRQFYEVTEGIKDCCPSAISQRKLLNGSQKRGFLLPEITKAREDFESKVGSKIKWT